MQNEPVWADGLAGEWRPLPRLRGEVETDVCVIGLGGGGLAGLDELTSLGVRSVGIDAASVAGAAAGRNGGFLRAGLPSFHHDAVARYGGERAARLYRLTAAARDRLAREWPELVHRTGCLRLAHDLEEERDCRRQYEALRADDLAAVWYDGPLGVGVLVPGDAVCNPLARCRAQAAALLARGVRLFEQSPAIAVSGGLVETPAGRIRCRSVVACLDGGLAELLPELADRVRPARLQMLATAPDPARTMPAAVGTRWGWDYWQQTADGRVALGGCRDAGGEAEWTSDPTPTARVQGALEQRLRGALRVDAPITHRWAAVVSYTASGLPVLEEVRPRVWAAGAYSGTGNLLGDVLGRSAARLASGRAVESPLD